MYSSVQSRQQPYILVALREVRELLVEPLRLRPPEAAKGQRASVIARACAGVRGSPFPVECCGGVTVVPVGGESLALSPTKHPEEDKEELIIIPTCGDEKEYTKRQPTQ